MTQAIDPVKLKAAAEHLEWVLKQYPDSEDVRSLLHSFTPMIEDAKAGRVLEPVDSMKIPGAWNFGDGTTEGLLGSPTHTYTSDGAYTVTMTASNQYGASDTEVKPGFINVGSVPPVNSIQILPGWNFVSVPKK